MDKLYRLAAFPKTIEGGNKAGVYVFADTLSEKQMQAIAFEVGYSETAFVMKSEVADFKVRFFTPISEVDLCGHATIATFNLLRDLGIIETGIFTQETKAGILRLDVRETMVFMEQPQPVFDEYVSSEELADCFLFLELHDVLKPRIVSTGLREIFLPLSSKKALEMLKPDFEAIIKLAEAHRAIGIHAFCLDDEVDAYGRNFAPVVGVNEESATGTSNGALGCYLFHHHQQKESYVLRQGYTMRQPSEIITRLETDQDNIVSVWVGGSARIIQ